MPITPQQAKLGQDAETEDDFEYHCKRIDKMLKEGGRTYACSLFADYRVVSKVIEAYHAAGWNVHQVSDFRDGNFLEFKDESWR